MPIINSLTHAIIYFNTKEGSIKSGIHAMMKLCFGSDKDVLGQVLYRTQDGHQAPIWTLPTSGDGGSGITYPIFVGKLAEEILVAVGRAADRFKKAPIEGSYYGRSFRVSQAGAEEIKAATTESK